MLSAKTTCSYPGCKCALEARYVSWNGRDYCSGDCADGLGCDHEQCDCGRKSPHPPGFSPLVKDRSRDLHDKP